MLQLATLAFLMSAHGQVVANQGASSSALVSSRIEDRLVKRFDFDEEALGNYESVPMNWQQLVKPGHPRYLEPGFDKKIGHDAPPSFSLALTGGSLACRYLAKDISVHPECDYLVTAWVRPKNLVHARAYVTASFLDHAMQPIASSMRTSREVRGQGSDEPWSRVSIHLPAGFERARWIGLSVHVEQAVPARAGPDDPRPIHHEDIHGAAWFDDITVLRFPRVSLRFSALGNVFEAGQPAVCDAWVADLDGRGLDTRLDVLDAEGDCIASHAVGVTDLESAAQRIELKVPTSGYYQARLTVIADGQETITRQQSFVCLAAMPEPIGRGRGGFGVTLGADSLSNRRVFTRLIELISPEAVKVPLWRAPMDDAAVVEGDKTADRLIRTLREQGVRLVGVLAQPPRSLADNYGHPDHTVLDVLAGSPGRWRPYLAFLLARYGEEISAWQVGDDQPRVENDRRTLAAALTNVQGVLRPLVGTPLLAATQDVLGEPSAGAPGDDVVSLFIPSEISSGRLASQVAPFMRKGVPAVWATLQSLPHQEFEDRSLMAETARRIVEARQAGIGTVFVPQPWVISGDDGLVMPDRSFVVLHTLSHALSGLVPMGEIELQEGVTSRLFGEPGGEKGVLVVWSDGDASEATRVTTDAISNARQFDIFGRMCPIESSPGGRILKVDAVPSLVMPVETRRVLTSGSFHLDQPELQVQIEPNRRRMKLQNHFGVPLSGLLALAAPHGWRVSPSRIKIDLGPSEWTEIELDISLPGNQPIGDFVILGQLRGEGRAASEMIFRTTAKVVCPGLDVNVMTRVEGENLHIVQRITNLTGRVMDLRTLVIYPDDRRDTRMVRQLADGSTTVREYSIDRAGQVRGRPIRVTAEEPDGGLRCHRIVMVE